MENTINNAMNFADLLSSEESLKPLSSLLDSIMNLPDESLNENAVDVLKGMIGGTFTSKVKEEAIEAVVKSFREEGYSKPEVSSIVDALDKEFAVLIDNLKPSEYKKQLLEHIIGLFNNIFIEARARFGVFDIELPIMLEEGAQMPIYAHGTDACADLFIAEDVTVPSHTMSTMLRTGVHIALPQGWVALIFPRSSIGSKTSLRLSNSVGVIDEEYRGPLGVLYDNVSDSDVTFKQGDRIAQMMVMPSYKFKGNQVTELSPSSRGEGGFGSTGK